MFKGVTIDGMLVGGPAFNCQELDRGDVVTHVLPPPFRPTVQIGRTSLFPSLPAYPCRAQAPSRPSWLRLRR